MGVAGEISKHVLWPGKRSPGIDDPLSVAQRRQMGSERIGIFHAGQIIEELELTRGSPIHSYACAAIGVRESLVEILG
jgi:hypothetical protein